MKNKKTLHTYAELKDYLLKEYKDKASMLDIHNKLVAKKKTLIESYTKYMYDMYGIAGDKIDEKSMVAYVVHEDMKTKLTLYEAKNQKELKDIKNESGNSNFIQQYNHIIVGLV